MFNPPQKKKKKKTTSSRSKIVASREQNSHSKKTLILRRDRKLLLPKRRWRAQPFFVTERHNLSFMCHCYWSQYFKGKERGGGGVWGHFMNHIEQKIKMNILSLFSQTKQSFLKHRYNPIYNFLNWSLPSTVGYLRF